LQCKRSVLLSAVSCCLLPQAGGNGGVESKRSVLLSVAWRLRSGRAEAGGAPETMESKRSVLLSVAWRLGSGRAEAGGAADTRGRGNGFVSQKVCPFVCPATSSTASAAVSRAEHAKRSVHLSATTASAAVSRAEHAKRSVLLSACPVVCHAKRSVLLSAMSCCLPFRRPTVPRGRHSGVGRPSQSS
jgi:hypothetical protein